eukprot:scaffold75827_cov21-Cyclotella_meneghiniana.AAC.1
MFLRITQLNIYYLHSLDLVCCDFCSKSYHAKCHIPCLQLDDQLSDEKWKCCKCSKEHSTNPQQQRHNRLKAQGWSFGRNNSKNGELLKISPDYKLQFFNLGAAEDFQEFRDEFQGDECKAAKAFEKIMNEEGINITPLLVGGIRALQSVQKNKMAMQKKNERTAQLVSPVIDKFQSRAKTSLANLSDGWEAVTYKSKATEELHFLSPIYS